MLVRMILSAISGVVGFFTITTLLKSIDMSEWSPLVTVFVTQIIPIVFGVTAIMGTISAGYNSPVQKYIRYKKWDAFGNRLKIAYTAKFGYPNPAFDEKVNQDIIAVKSLGKGFTKSINMDNLKALAKFVEVPFIIPEEEYLSEEDKVTLFEEEYGGKHGK